MAADTPPVPEENAEEIIDLTELIERGDAAPTPDVDAHIQSLNAQAAGEDAEIEALLAQMDASDGATLSQGPAAPLGEPAATPGVVDPHEQLDMSDMGDIDNLLASLDIPPQPRDSAPAAPAEAPRNAPEAAAEAPAAPADGDMTQSLDKAMDELLNGNAPQAPGPAAAPSPAAAPATPAGPSVEELLAAAAAPATPAAPTAPEPDLDADLDALLNEAATAAPSAPATPGAPDLDADLDSLLNSLDAETQAPVEPAPAAPTAPDVAAAAPSSAMPAPDMLPDDPPEAVSPPSAAPLDEAPEAGDLPSGDLPEAAPEADMFPGGLPEAAPAPSEAPVADEAAPEADAMFPMTDAVPEPAPAAMEEPARPDDAAPAGMEREAAAPADAAEPVPDPMRDATDAAAPATVTACPGETEDFAALAETLGERLRQCEADLAAARARIEALEHSTADSVSLGDLLREGSPLHNGFAALIASSVGQALKDTPPPVCLPGGVEERINALEAQGKSLAARMDALEGRLDRLEPRFNEEVGKAAAGAVARILREEISRLAGG